MLLCGDYYLSGYFRWSDPNVVPSETEKIVSKYIKRFRLTPDAPLFCNKNGERLTRQGIRYIIQKYSKMANKNEPGIIESSAYPHILRHSKATHLVNRGVNIYNVRDFLGHESVATTQIYLTTNPEITRKTIESVAEKTVPESLDFFSEEERDDLLFFLDSLG